MSHRRCVARCWSSSAPITGFGRPGTRAGTTTRHRMSHRRRWNTVGGALLRRWSRWLGHAATLRHRGEHVAGRGAANDRAGAARRSRSFAAAGNGRGDGGETVRALSEALGATRLDVLAEYEPASRSRSGATVAGPERRSCPSPGIRFAGSVRPGGRIGHDGSGFTRNSDDPSCRDRGRPRRIGPEIILKAAPKFAGRRDLELVVVAPRASIDAAAKRLGGAYWTRWQAAATRAASCSRHCAARRGNQDRRGVRGGGRGRVRGHRARGRTGDVGARECHRDGTDQQGGAESCRAPFSGHTELLAHLSGGQGPVMMLAHGRCA